MATAHVPAVWVASRTLPPVCARHEAPATRQSKRDFYTRTPSWVYLTLLIGILVAAIIAMALRTTVKGQLPACERCVSERRKFVATAWASWVLAIALLVLGISLSSTPLLVVSGLAILVALVISVSGDRFRVTGTVSKDRQWVDLKGTSEGFSQLVRQAVEQQGWGLGGAGAVAPVQPQMAQAQPTAAPQLSADGLWWWDGGQWIPAANATRAP
jgi:hypothetical protein